MRFYRSLIAEISAVNACIKVLMMIRESSSSQPRASDPPNRAMMMMMAGKGIKRQGPERNRLDGIGSRHGRAGIDNLLADQTDIGAIVGCSRPRPRAREALSASTRTGAACPVAFRRTGTTVKACAERR